MFVWILLWPTAHNDRRTLHAIVASRATSKAAAQDKCKRTLNPLAGPETETQNPLPLARFPCLLHAIFAKQRQCDP